MGMVVVTVGQDDAPAPKCAHCAVLETALAETQVILTEAMQLLQLYQRVLEHNQVLREAVAAEAAAQIIREMGV